MAWIASVAPEPRPRAFYSLRSMACPSAQSAIWRFMAIDGLRRVSRGCVRPKCESLYSGLPNPQETGRKFLPSNGGSIYIDMDHLEACTPEVLSSFDHVAACHGMLRIVREALHRANEYRPHGQRIQVLVNNSDGQGNSYGSHLNFLIRRRTYENLFQRKPHHLQFLATFQVSSILLTGQGKIGAENGRPSTPTRSASGPTSLRRCTACRPLTIVPS